MARFRIKDIANNGHYLRTDPPTEWEQIEVDQKTGRQMRQRYVVPRYLDPSDPFCWNYIIQPSGVGSPGSGEIIVTTKADLVNYPRDIVFLGSPTEGMEPLDAEAEELLRRLPRGVAPMSEQAFPTSGPSPGALAEQSEIAKFMAQMQGQMALLMGQNERLAMELAEVKAEREEPQFVDAPVEAQPEVRL